MTSRVGRLLRGAGGAVVRAVWLAAMAIPLDLLRARLNFGPETRLNVTMILESPEQKFVSATDLGAGEPDFHQPQRFPVVAFAPIPK